MTTIHPHWQETERDEPRPQSVDSLSMTTGQPAVIPAPRRTMSRRPAAILGVLAAMAGGFFLSQDLSSILPGQLTPAAEIRITQNGVTPPVVTVSQGDTVAWTNADSIPHILIAEGLKTVTDESLKTPSIFPSETKNITISPDAKPGTYLYISQTSETVAGQIIVQQRVVASSVASSVQSSSQSSSEDSVVMGSSAPMVIHEASSSASSVTPFTPPAATVIPTNPHVVGAPPSTWTGTAQPAQPTPAAAIHRPTRTTETGPATWVISLGSLLALAFLSRQSFRKLTGIPQR